MEHMILAPAIRELLEKQYERLGIENNFIFGKVMQDKNLCISMLECLTGNHIDDIKEITIKKQFKTCSDSKGVRYDIFVEDDSERIYDAEKISIYHSMTSVPYYSITQKALWMTFLTMQKIFSIILTQAQ